MSFVVKQIMQDVVTVPSLQMSWLTCLACRQLLPLWPDKRPQLDLSMSLLLALFSAVLYLDDDINPGIVSKSTAPRIPFVGSKAKIPI